MPKGILNLAEIEAIFDVIPSQTTTGIRDRAVMETYFATGIRRMELAGLNTIDIDMTSGLVTTGKKRAQMPKTTKEKLPVNDLAPTRYEGSTTPRRKTCK